MNRSALALVFAVFLLTGFVGLPGGFGMTPAHASEGKEAKEGVPTPDFEYMEMKPLTLPIITDQGLTQQVSLIVSLEIPYGKKAEVEGMTPRLADAYLQDLYGALGKGNAMMVNNVIDIQAVKKRLTHVTYKVLKEDQVHDVLLQVLQQRRMM